MQQANRACIKNDILSETLGIVFVRKVCLGCGSRNSIHI